MHINLKHKIIYLFATAGLISGLISTSVMADVAVIVNPGSGISAANAGDVKALFLGKSKSVGGKHVVAVGQKEGNGARATFNDKVLGKSGSQLKAYWTKLIFSGKGSPPKSLADDAAVKAHVAANAGAIGYIDSSKVDGTVTVILTVK